MNEKGMKKMTQIMTHTLIINGIGSINGIRSIKGIGFDNGIGGYGSYYINLNLRVRFYSDSSDSDSSSDGDDGDASDSWLTNSNMEIYIPNSFTLAFLAFKVIDLYKHNHDLFSGMSHFQVAELVRRIRSGNYQMSPVILEKSKKISELKAHYPGKLIYHLSGDNGKSVTDYGCLILDKEDELVLMALGLILNQQFYDMRIQKEFSFGFREKITSYYNHVSSIKKPISTLYIIDMNPSLLSIDKDDLLSRLEPIVKNHDIMKILKDFLYFQILCKDGQDNSNLNNVIPRSNLITDVLLNYCLLDMDSLFRVIYPTLSYSRYIGEIIVSTPEGEEMLINEISELMSSLNLDGKIISIGPGEHTHSYYGGIMTINKEGLIHIEKTNQFGNID